MHGDNNIAMWCGAVDLQTKLFKSEGIDDAMSTVANQWSSKVQQGTPPLLVESTSRDMREGAARG